MAVIRLHRNSVERSMPEKKTKKKDRKKLHRRHTFCGSRTKSISSQFRLSIAISTDSSDATMVWKDVSAFLSKHRPRRKQLPREDAHFPVTADDFTKSRWPCLPWWFFPSFYCLSTLYFSFWLIASWVSFKDNKKGKGKWFIFLTNWSFAVLVIQIYCLTIPIVRHLLLPRFRRWKTAEADAGVAGAADQSHLTADGEADDPPLVRFHFQQVNLDDESCTSEKTLVVTRTGVTEVPEASWGSPSVLSYFHRVAWVVDNIAATMAIGVTIAFWSFLYDKKQPVNSVTIHTHGVNAAFVVIDQVLCRRPRHLAHIFQPILFGLTYVFFTFLYYCSGGTDPAGRHFIYPFLDWQRPGPSLLFTLLFAVVLTGLLYLFTYVGFRLRTFVYRRFCVGPRPRASVSSACANAIEQEINEFLQIKV